MCTHNICLPGKKKTKLSGALNKYLEEGQTVNIFLQVDY